MLLGPLLSVLMEFVEVGIQLIPIYPPHAPASQLDGGKAARADQGIDLRNAHAQIVGHVFEREESGLQGRLSCLLSALGSALRGGHRLKIAPARGRYLDLASFAPVWTNS